MQTTQRPGFVADVVRRLRDRFLGSKRRHSVPAPSGRRLRSLARHETLWPRPYPPDYSESNKSQTQYDNYAPFFYAKML
ncbi:hypothetical protein PP714_06010 [Lacticaseibacillus paracasei]|nr:hypothetical protein [Lacticaseibacillus paracasei]